MKGFMVEIRNKNDLNTAVGKGSLVHTASPRQRYNMAMKLMDRAPYGDYVAIEYRADWTDCSSPKFKEIKRYELDEQTGTPVGETTQKDTIMEQTLTEETANIMSGVTSQKPVSTLVDVDDDDEVTHVAPPVTPPPSSVYNTKH